MRIVSKFSDYYDIGVSYGIDKNIYFDRKLEKPREVNFISFRTRSQNKDGFTYFFYRGIIGFCGKLYPFVFVKKYLKVLSIVEEKEKFIEEKFFYSKKEFNEYIGFSDSQRKYSWFHPDTLFEYSCLDKSQLMEIFIKYKTPIFSYSGITFDGYDVPDAIRMTSGLNINPILSKFKFSIVKEAIPAFQEISMYLGALKHPEVETTDMDDKVIAQSKGFNCMSFKKQGKKEHKC